MTLYISKKAKIKFNIRVYYEDARRFLLWVIAILSALLIIIASACIILASRFDRIDIEAGERISAEEHFGVGARFSSDFKAEWQDTPGVYYFSVLMDGVERRVRLSVKDTKAPVVKLKDAYFAVGGEFPSPFDYIESVFEPGEFSGEYLSELPKLTSPGEYTAKVRYADASGNMTEVFEVKMIQIYDNQPPTLEVPPLIVCPVGGTVEYKPYVTLSDNCIGKLSFSVDESGLDLSAVGEYTVYVTGSDLVGNKSERVAVTVKVVDAYDEDVLSSLLDEMVDRLDIEGKSSEQLCRDIYKTVRKALVYTGDSQKGDVSRAAYFALTGGGGDCYSYFALTKLLLDRCGIENFDVQRAEGYTEDTHYWSLVNIGDGGADAWYHLDATELRTDRYDHSGCLLTDKQINAYSKVRTHFYTYDKHLYPNVSDKIITPTPRLEELY